MHPLSTWIWLAERVRQKRRHIQRRAVFNEPVYSLHLEELTGEEVSRTDTYTDHSPTVDTLNEYAWRNSDTLNKAWYSKASDLAIEDPRPISKETDINESTIEEIVQLARQERDISFTTKETTQETVPTDDAIDSLTSSTEWCQLLLLELGLWRTVQIRLQSSLEKYDIQTKQGLIEHFSDQFLDESEHIDDISYLTGASEQYVKDVISGRAEAQLTEVQRDDILRRDNKQCKNCGSQTALEIHHIIPVSSGGESTPENLCTLCNDCHLEIGHGETTADIPYKDKKEFWTSILDIPVPADDWSKI